MYNIPYKRITILFIKYGPTAMALSCAIKIWAISEAGGFNINPLLKIVNYVNLIISLLTLALLYSAGKTFNFCWKHQSLCRLTFIGYVYFFLALSFSFSECYEIKVLAIGYATIVLLFSLIYRFINVQENKENN